MTTYVFFVWKTYMYLFLFSSFVPITTQNANDYELLHDHYNCLTFDSHICSFASMIS